MSLCHLIGVAAWGIQVWGSRSDELRTGVRKELLIGGVNAAHHSAHLLIVPAKS